MGTAATSGMTAAKAWVATWTEAGRVMEGIRIDTLRRLDEGESAKWFNDLDTSPENIWRRPEHCEGRGLIEQQRLFSKLHAH